MPNTAPYGTWKSPITAGLIASKATSLIAVTADGEDIYWVESHPTQGGRYTIMRRKPDGEVIECTPPEFYVRTTVHEYGGAAFAVLDGIIYFTNFKDQRLYRQHPGGNAEVLTPGEGYRYADIVVDRARDRLICIREDHTGSGEAVNAIVSVGLTGGDNGQILVDGNDFYSSPRLSPDGRQLAYLTWNHPNMPWDGCELWISNVRSDGKVDPGRQVTGGSDVSVFQPEWSPDGVLHFVSDISGWWNLYRWRDGSIEELYPMEAEFGTPQWEFGMSTYDFASGSRLLCFYSKDGVDHLAWLDTSTKHLTTIVTPYTEISDVRCGNGFAVLIAGSALHPSTVVRLDTENDSLLPLKAAFEITVDSGYLSIPQALSFPTSGGNQAHAFYYPPRNADWSSESSERPPLVVISHGGPTAATGTGLRYSIQYWTSRGFAVLDVNYGGSSGYGRAYRQRLNGQWGKVDVDDCCNGALHLVEQGLVDRDRMAIRGGSAGGYTTLACLTFRSDIFTAGASYYGLADLELFATDTHKFESRYLYSLLGSYPEHKATYVERSPIHFADNLACPLILFQGEEDKIVPSSQAEIMFEAVRAKGLPVAYLLFEGEQHGFRKAENIKRSLEAELYFYSRIFGFEPADFIEPVKIENL